MAIFRNLFIWQKSIDLVKDIYKITENFPKDEIYGSTSQIKFAAISIPSNIAKGKGKNTNKEFIQFLHIALGSIFELQTQLKLAERLNIIKDISEIKKITFEIEKMLNSLINSKKDDK